MVDNYDKLYYIDDMGKEDLSQVISIRNHPDTLMYLHTPVSFSLDQCLEWFDKTSPIWYCIKDINNMVVGYFRISNVNYDTKSLYIGCDIHPDYRKRGIAKWGYEKVFDMLRNRGWDFISLEVLKTNNIAINLYNKLGFKNNGEDSRSFFMTKKISDNLEGGSVKVICCYLGNRRKGFFKPSHMIKMLEDMWRKEEEIDNGLPMDTLLIYNKMSEEDASRMEDIENYKKSERYLYSLDGKKTRNGMCYVVERENVGVSFGAFDFAFNKFKDKYKYWMFIEDDQIVVKDNVMKVCIKQLMDIKNFKNQCGFVAVVGVSEDDQYLKHCHGGVGCSSRYILDNVRVNNYSYELGRGSLPYYNKLVKFYDNDNRIDPHQTEGEVKFTSIIRNIGYDLRNIDMEDVVVSWGSEWKRNIRIVPHSSAFLINKKLCDIDITYNVDYTGKFPLIYLFPSKEYEYRHVDVNIKKLLDDECCGNYHFDFGSLDHDYYYWIIPNINKDLVKDYYIDICEDGNVIKKFIFPLNKII